MLYLSLCHQIRQFLHFIPIAAISFLFIQHTSAQIIPDQTLRTGERSRVRNQRIEGGAVRENTLFHSFREFNINRRQRIFFDNPPDIDNILTRVTGNNASHIQGMLGVDGGANLFLINPNGIIFSGNARLNLRGGSFIGSTASSIQLTQDSRFDAINPQSPPNTLNIEVPIGLRLRNSSSEIQVENVNLTVPPGETLALLGSNLEIENSSIAVSAGRIELGALEQGLIRFSSNSDRLALQYPERDNYQNIDISDRSTIIATAPNGSLHIRAASVQIREGAEVSSTVLLTENGGDLIVIADESVSVSDDGTFLATQVGRRDQSTAENLRAIGNGGNLTIRTEQLTVEDGAQVSTTTFGPGSGGNLTIIASEVSVIEPPDIVITTVGDNTFVTYNPNLFNSGIYTGVEGRTQNSARLTERQGGNLVIETESLRIDNAPISTSIFGPGEPGSLRINASDTVEILNTGGIFSIVGDRAIAGGTSVNGGQIVINTGDLILRNNAQINASNNARGGDAGNIEINVDFLIASPLENNDITANAETEKAGEIVINAENGAIFGIQASNELTSRSDVVAASRQGVDGTVELNAPDVDPSRGLVEFPIVLIDPESLVDQRCQPGQVLATNRLEVTGEDQDQTEQNLPIEAQGWVRQENSVELKATVDTVLPYSSWSTPDLCESPN